MSTMEKISNMEASMMNFKKVMLYSCLIVLGGLNIANASSESVPSKPALGTAEGCRDALNIHKYGAGNFNDISYKIATKHMYDSRNQAPKRGEVQFDFSVVGDADHIFTYISGNCVVDRAQVESGRGDPEGSGACYFKCSGAKPIGQYWNDHSHESTKELKLIYANKRDLSSAYHLVSIYPAQPTN